MGLSRKQIESRVAFALALDLLEVYLADEIAVVLGEAPTNVRVSDALDLGGLVVANETFTDWYYTLNCVMVPTCCAGECTEFDMTPIGHLDIKTPRATYSFSIDVLTTIDWEV